MNGFDQTPLLRRARRGLNCALQKSLYWSCAGEIYRRVRGAGGAVILMYHSVPGAGVAGWVDPDNSLSPELFERQMAFLRRWRRVISLGELIDMVEQRRDPPAGAVVLTFDDGYLDNLEVVAPILERFGLPATLYLATGYVGRAEPQWIDQLYGMFRRRTEHGLRLEGWEEELDLREAAAGAWGYRMVARQLLSLGHEERKRVLELVAARLKPAEGPPALTMNWEQVRQLVQRYPLFEIGAHTADHIDLSAADESVIRREVKRSAEDIGRELGRTARHFSFPYGRCSAAAVEIVRESGFRSAMAAGEDLLINGRSDAMRLARLAAPTSMTLFRYYTSGAHPGLTRALTGRA